MTMTKKREIYRCSVCGNVVEVLNAGALTVCCGRPMNLLKSNTTDGSTEKHVPVIEKTECGYRVRVGSSDHPMTADHYIQWIELRTQRMVLRMELQPGDKPEAFFRIDSPEKCRMQQSGESCEQIKVFAYCNLHGLWSVE